MKPEIICPCGLVGSSKSEIRRQYALTSSLLFNNVEIKVNVVYTKPNQTNTAAFFCEYIVVKLIFQYQHMNV
jgi:hypothetical protein